MSTTAPVLVPESVESFPLLEELDDVVPELPVEPSSELPALPSDFGAAPHATTHHAAQIARETVRVATKSVDGTARNVLRISKDVRRCVHSRAPP
ncbi:MAG TPA: hypothetical protein VG755_30380 [Nannocystaceae bacterium]|nr:hypothetical protein [Nannocystaceae bacterium]